MRSSGKLVAFVLLALFAACSSQKEPAENAVARLDTTLEALRTDAEQYASDQLQSVQTSMDRLKEYLERQDYAAVTRTVPRVAAEMEALREATETAKSNAVAMLAEAQSEWDALNESVPPMVEKLQARVDQLARSRKYPKGMNKAQFEAAKSELETIKNEWLEAGDEFASGQAGDAVRKARNAKAMAEELIQELEVRA